MPETPADIARQVLQTTKDVSAVTTTITIFQTRAALQWLERVGIAALRAGGTYLPNHADLTSIGWIAARVLIPKGQVNSKNHPLHRLIERILGFDEIRHNPNGSWTFLRQPKS